MRAESVRLLVELAIQRGLREIRRGDCRRVIRSLVEDACHLVRSGYPSRLFADLQEMFHTEVHPYFELFGHVAATLDARFFTGFAINLCYESWARGAGVLRSEQQRQGRAIPWLLTIDLDAMPLSHVMAQMEEHLRSGGSAFLLRSQGMPQEALACLSACYPRCALAALLPDEALTEDSVQALAECGNLLLIAARREGEFAAAQALRAHRCLYALCRTLDEGALRTLMEAGDLRCPGDEPCAFPMFLPDDDVPAELAEAFNEWLEQLRQHPAQPVFPIDLRLDPARVQRQMTGAGQ